MLYNSTYILLDSSCYYGCYCSQYDSWNHYLLELNCVLSFVKCRICLWMYVLSSFLYIFPISKTYIYMVWCMWNDWMPAQKCMKQFRFRHIVLQISLTSISDKNFRCASCEKHNEVGMFNFRCRRYYECDCLLVSALQLKDCFFPNFWKL